MKSYGIPDPDPTVLNALLQYMVDRPIIYLIHKERVPVDARPCRMPCSLSVQAVTEDRRVVTAFQPSPGKPVRITET